MQKYLFILVLVALSVYAQGQRWTNVQEKDIIQQSERYIQPTKYFLSQLDNASLFAILKTAPQESGGSSIYESSTVITIPLPDGSFDRFKIMEYNMVEADLKSQYPDIRTYYGVSESNPYRSIMADYTAFGFKAMITTINEGMVFIDNYQMGDNDIKIIYNKKDNPRRERWFCGVKDEDFDRSVSSERSMMTGDCQLREYRLALSTTGEYTDFFIPGPSPPTAVDSTAANIALVHSAVVTSINRVNGVYMKDLAMRCILVANNNILYYFSPTTDGYTNTDGVAMLTQNQNKTTARIGSANYDVGHVFSTGGGGVASLNSPCAAGTKARGVTGSGAPVGDAFDIDYVAHEMGHQFGGPHTFNNSCGGNVSASSAMEPGSGSTIMAYAGICSPNVQNNSDAYYHALSLQQIKAFLSNGGNCGALVPGFANSTPTVTQQPNYSIPISTPFALTLSAGDPNGNPLSYLWDQMDNQIVTQPPVATSTGGPTFRSISPTISPTRNFPNLTGILAGLTTSSSGWEVLPSVARTMNFRGVVRDFTGLFGCNNEINVQVATMAGTSQFSITSDNLPTPIWTTGQSRTVTWNVGGTNANGINCLSVDILWSTDAGLSWILLESDVPNDGSQEVIVPSNPTTSGRFMVKAKGNIFFDINNTNITVSTTGSSPTFNIQLTPWYHTICAGQTKTYTINVSSFSGYTAPVTLSLPIITLPGFSASFSSNPVTPGSSSILTITNVSAPVGTTVVGLTGTSSTISKISNFSLSAAEIAGSFTLSTPSNSATNVLQRILCKYQENLIFLPMSLTLVI
jgi:hypothetical protein